MNILLLTLISNVYFTTANTVPVVINTWAFSNANAKAWEAIQKGSNYIEALEAGCASCEEEQCDGTVGFGGSPNENGETTLDAMIFDGVHMNIGAVAAMRRIKSAISVARHVLEHTQHSLVVGDEATNFAIQMGFREETLTTNRSHAIWNDWKTVKSCQPNNWLNVEPDPSKTCGPYQPISENAINYNRKKWRNRNQFGTSNHDTIGMIVIDANGKIAAGTSTNGMTFKIPGRVGDSPIPGAGAYADNDVGAASSTGDGDIMMRFLPSFLAVEELRRGKSPEEAARTAIRRIVQKYPKFFGGIVVVNKHGEYAAACNGMEQFPYSIANNDLNSTHVFNVNCVS